MIIGIGVDLVDTRRLEKWTDVQGIYSRFFHPKEVEYCLSRGPLAHHSLSARFAAKEAFGKALGTGLSGIALKDIQVVNDESGQPSLVLHDTAKKAFDRRGGVHLHLSLSHDKDSAVAMVVIEK